MAKENMKIFSLSIYVIMKMYLRVILVIAGVNL